MADSDDARKDHSPWSLPYYEDIVNGSHIRSPYGRTLTDVDNIWFTLLVMDRNQIHFNSDYTAKNYKDGPFNGRLVMNGILVLAIVNGLTNEYTSARGFVLGLDQIQYKNPTFSGDTLYSSVEIVSKRLSKSRQGYGVVVSDTRGENQDGAEVISFRKTFMLPLHLETGGGE